MGRKLERTPTVYMFVYICFTNGIVIMFTNKESERWSKCIRQDGDHLIWTGHHTNGYPVFYYRGSYHQARRLAVGLPTKKTEEFVRTTCGERSCVCKEHLAINKKDLHVVPQA